MIQNQKNYQKLQTYLTQLNDQLVKVQQGFKLVNNKLNLSIQADAEIPFVNTKKVDNMDYQQLTNQIRKQTIKLIQSIQEQCSQHIKVTQKIQDHLQILQKTIQNSDEMQQKLIQERGIKQMQDLTDNLQKSNEEMQKTMSLILNQHLNQQSRANAILQAAKMINVFPLQVQKISEMKIQKIDQTQKKQKLKKQNFIQNLKSYNKDQLDVKLKNSLYASSVL